MTSEQPTGAAIPDPKLAATPEHETAIDTRAVLKKRLRLALVVLLFIGSIVLAKLTGIDQYMDRETVRTFMTGAGAWGFLAYIALFAVGALMHVPGWVFVGAASVSYPQPWAAIAAYVGALAAVSLSFFVVRGVGGQALAEVRWPIMRKVLGRLETHPVRTVVILRLLMLTTPALNYALAMSKLRFRDYFVGAAIGLLVPIPLMSVLFEKFGDVYDQLLTWF